MIRDSKERIIAKIISIDAYKFEAELLESVNSFNINGFDEIYQFIQLNGYVLVRIESSYIVASISSIREADSNNYLRTDSNALNKVDSVKVLELFPLGVLSEEEFSFGVSNYPLLYSDVLYIKESELIELFQPSKNNDCGNLTIGTWSLKESHNIKINIDKFFGFHSAILGNTGSGKSCTISAIIQEVIRGEFPNSQFIFFDINGEYDSAFKGIAKDRKLYTFNVISEEKNYSGESFNLPATLLTVEEWELLLQASSKTQSPVLRTAINIYGLDDNSKVRVIAFTIKQMYLSETSPLLKYQRIQTLKRKLMEFDPKHSTIDKGYNSMFGHFNGDKAKEKCFLLKLDNLIIEPFDIENLNNQGKPQVTLQGLDEYIELAILWEESHGNKQIRDYCSSMVTRLKNISSRPEYNFLNSKHCDVKQFVEGIITKSNKPSNISIINFNNMDDEIIEVVSAVLTRIIFDYLKKQLKRNEKPIHLVLDEAHRYISKRKSGRDFFEANRVFERVAKEARKFGLLMILSSQRPSELNETVLSQCSNFIVHRVQNPDDLNYLRAMTPFISRAMLEKLPSIPQQEALIFGSAINLPLLFKVKNAAPLPDSLSNKITRNWQKNSKAPNTQLQIFPFDTQHDAISS